MQNCTLKVRLHWHNFARDFALACTFSKKIDNSYLAKRASLMRNRVRNSLV
jgi:hypothetical protein